jgi:hypothetical protein
MNRLLLLSALFLSSPAIGAPGIVRTLDSNSISGEIRFSTMGVMVSNRAHQTTIPLTNLLRLELTSGGSETSGPRGHGIGLLGFYFSNTNLAGTCYARLDEKIDFSWANEQPAPRVPRESFSVLWLGQVEAPVSGDYSFFITSDEGGRLFLKNQYMIERWGKRDTADSSMTLFLKAGERLPFRMEYFHSTDNGKAKLSWSGPGIPKGVVPAHQLYPASNLSEHIANIGPATNGLLVTFYDKPDLTGNTFTRVDSGVQFMASNAPAPRFSPTNYSVRWNGQIRADFTEPYTFHITADEGVRFSVNGATLVDHWEQDQPQELAQQLSLVAGEKTDLELELKNTQGGASARLEWSSVSVPKSLIPADHLFPSKPAVHRALADTNAKTPVGLALRNGGFVGTKVAKATETQISVSGALQRITFSTVNIARIICQPLSQTMAAKIPSGRTGVLLSNGDFIESDFRSLDDKTVQVSSVLFGLRNYDAKKDVVAIILREPQSSTWQYQILLEDQTRLFVGRIALNPEGITLLDPAFGNFRLAAPQVRALKRNTGNTSFAEVTSVP